MYLASIVHQSKLKGCQAPQVSDTILLYITIAVYLCKYGKADFSALRIERYNYNLNCIPYEAYGNPDQPRSDLEDN